MIKTILILWVVNGFGNASQYTSPHSVEYDSPVDCLHALEAVKKAVKSIDGVCTVK